MNEIYGQIFNADCSEHYHLPEDEPNLLKVAATIILLGAGIYLAIWWLAPMLQQYFGG